MARETEPGSTRRQVRPVLVRGGMAGLSLLVLCGLLLTDFAPTADAARPRRDRAERARIVPGEAVEAREARPAAARRGVHTEVVGGEPVAPGAFTFASFIKITIGPSTGFCTGSLITPRHVVTAAHCAEDAAGEDFEPSQFELTIGRTSRIDPPAANLFLVEDVFVHPLWDRNAFKNDVAVLRLDREVPASIAQPIAMIAGNDTQFDVPGQSATGAGWGLTVGPPEGEEGSPDLLQLATSVISDAVCDAAFSHDLDEESVLCAQVPARSLCNGDSGGPLFVLTGGDTAGRQSRGADRAQEVLAEGKKSKKAKKRKKQKQRKKRRNNSAETPLLIGVASFAIVGCPTGSANGFAQVSAPILRDFVTDAISD